METALNIMKSLSVTVEPSTSVGRSIELMLENNTDILVVVDDLSHPIGTVTGSTLLSAALDSHLRNDPISLHMTRKFVSISAKASLDTVIDQFILHRIRNLPVVDNGKLVGIISRQDVLVAVFGKEPSPVPHVA